MADSKLPPSKAAKGMPDTDEQLKVARDVMERRHQALRALAEQIMEKDRGILSELGKS